MAEWLRHWNANSMDFVHVGSNPILVVNLVGNNIQNLIFTDVLLKYCCDSCICAVILGIETSCPSPMFAGDIKWISKSLNAQLQNHKNDIFEASC